MKKIVLSLAVLLMLSGSAKAAPIIEHEPIVTHEVRPVYHNEEKSPAEDYTDYENNSISVTTVKKKKKNKDQTDSSDYYDFSYHPLNDDEVCNKENPCD